MTRRLSGLHVIVLCCLLAAMEAAPGGAAAQTAPLPLPDMASPGDDSTGEALPPQEDVPLPDTLPFPVPGASSAKPVPPPPPQTVPSGPQAVVLQALDKVTARISVVEVPVGGTARFGSLLIAARACQKSPPEEPPEAAAFLEITETPAGAIASSLFSGWMFASSPALSALEHPVYDVWVKDCKALAPSAP